MLLRLEVFFNYPMNFTPTKFKSIISIVIGLVSAYYIYPGLTICSVSYCYYSFFQLYAVSLLFGLSMSVLTYGIWSCFSKGASQVTFSKKIIAIFGSILFSILVLCSAYFIAIEWNPERKMACTRITFFECYPPSNPNISPYGVKI